MSTENKQIDQDLLSALSFLLQIPEGDLEVKKVTKRKEDVPPSAVIDVGLHFISNSSAMYAVGEKMLTPYQKALEVRSRSILLIMEKASMPDDMEGS